MHSVTASVSADCSLDKYCWNDLLFAEKTQNSAERSQASLEVADLN